MDERSLFSLLMICVYWLFTVAAILKVLRGPLASNATVAWLCLRAIGNMTDVNEQNRNLFAIDDGCDGE